MKELLQKISKAGILVEVVDGKLKLYGDGNDIDRDILQAVKANKEAITAYFIQNNIGTIYKKEYETIPVVPVSKSYPISDAQRRLWLLSQFEESSIAYNSPGNVYLDEDVDLECFQRAINSTIDRHEILRTIFKPDESGEVRQWVLNREELLFTIDYKDYRNEEHINACVESYISTDSFKIFDLEQGPLLRVCLMRIKEDRYVFYFNLHHIISDGWSMEVLSRDVFSFYKSYKENKEPMLKELKIQYKDYSAWQLSQQNKDSFKPHRNYWLKSLSGELPLLDLPSHKQRPRVKTNNGKTIITSLSKAVSEDLKSYSQAQGGTLFMGLLAALNALLYRYTGQTDLIIGTPIAGREHEDLGDQIGFYVNTLAFRNEVRGDESFQKLFSRVKENTLEGYLHQMYPFDRLVEELNLVRDTSRSAVFDVMLVLQNNEENSKYNESFKQEEKFSKTSKFDLLINAQQQQGGELTLAVEYNTDVYEDEMISRLVNHYKTFLSELLRAPHEAIGKIDFLSGLERKELTQFFNDTKKDYGKATVMALFEEQVRKNPDKIALEFNNEVLTYQELNEQSNSLCHLLMENYQSSRLTKVGVMLERSLNSVVAMIGVMKTGACYVPLDHEYPKDRVSYIINDSSLDVIVTTKELAKKHMLKASSIVDIQDFDWKNGNRVNPVLSNELDDASYVIYTSGSTGNPKGVVQTHRMLTNLIKWDIHDSGIQPGLKYLQYASFSFDASIHDLYFTLGAGGSAYVINESLRLDYQSLKDVILSNGIEVLSMPFSALNAFCIEIEIENLKNHKIKYIVSTAEQLYVSVGLEKFLKKNPQVELHNHYGPSETHVITSYIMSSERGNIVNRSSIGKPLSNSSIYILDAYENLVPHGVIGELYAGGENLALGYLNLEALTNEKFIDTSFEKGKLYKTGDQGYWRLDGNIEYVGRKDNQVKIRGYRIELDEIEQALLKRDDIQEVVVLAKENKSNERELVAYITSKIEQNINDLRSYLQKLLPSYMLPVYFIQMKEMPLNGNGKIDKKKLPAPEGLGISSGVEYIAPRNETEIKMVEIWEHVLQRERIGINDDFFALGGHSLKAVRLINEYQRKLHVKLSLKNLFEHTSIATQIPLINSSKKEELIQITKAPLQKSYAISDAQRRLFILSQFEKGAIAYNIPGFIYLNEHIDIDCFKRAINATIDRHEILRTIFKEDEAGEIRQWIMDRKDLNFNIDYKDFRRETDREEKIKNYIEIDSYQAYDFEKGPLLRISLIQVADEKYMLYFNMHHIISDGWSMELLSKDVFSFYKAYKENKEPELKELRIQYKDYSNWQLAQLEDDSFNAHRNYWLKNLAGDLPVLNLPANKQRPRIKTSNGYGLRTYIDSATSGKLKQYSETNGGSLFMGLFAVWNVLMYRYTRQRDIIIGSPVAGRDHVDLEDQIGFYVNTLALRNSIDPQESFHDFYAGLKNRVLESYVHQMYPFDRLIEDLNLQRDTSRSAVFDVLFTLQNNGEKVVSSDFIDKDYNQLIDLGQSVSKFDMNVTFQEINNCLSLQLVFNPDVYEREMIESMINHYKQLMSVILQNPSHKIASFDYLSEQERKKLLIDFNDSKTDYPKNKTIVDLFEEQVLKTPDNIALVFEETKLTYRELDEQSNRLAHYLKEKCNIQPDDLIGIKLERSEWMIISILGILKSGAAYVPIDIDYPAERIAFMLENSKCKALIDDNELKVFKSKQADYASTRLKTKAKPDHLAYVIYTSGSTGIPKGVLINTRSIVDYAFGMFNKTNIKTCNHFGLVSTIAADLGNTVIYTSLLTGGSLQIISKEDILDVKKLKYWNFDCLKMTPSHWKALQSDDNLYLPNKCLILGGEEFPEELVKQLQLKNVSCEVYNHYGPTETTIGKLVKHIEKKQNVFPIALGTPIGNNQVYILDEAQLLCPIGVPGEICISGDGTARGYLNNEQVSSKKFIAHPFKKGERLYCTGDLGIRLPNGDVKFIGRNDDQVKVRGYRIEPGEIAQILKNHNEIDAAIVVTRESETNGKELIAYITSRTEQNINDISSYLKQFLPDYMLPSHYVQLKELPLTSNGKIDRKSLPDPTGIELATGKKYVAPGNDLEKKLVVIWERILQRENIGVTDDFFTLGGHSLKAMKLLMEYNKTFNVRLSLQDVFFKTQLYTHAELIEIQIWVKEDLKQEALKTENTETFNF